MSHKRMKAMMGKILAFAILAMCITGLYSNSFGAAAKTDFYDIKGHWSEMAIDSLIERGVIQGASVNGVLEAMPDRSISRAEFVAIVVRAFNLKPIDANIKTFNDEIKGAWYIESLKTATSNSLIAGYPDGGFHPGDPLTNVQISIILTRLKNQQLESSGQTVDDSWYVSNVLSPLRDEFKLVPENSFIPKNNATRAETMSALYCFIKVTEKTEENTLEQGIAGTSQVVLIGGGGNSPVIIGSSDPAGTGSAGGGSTTPEQEPAKTGVQGYNITAAKGELVYFQIYAYLLTELGGFDFKITYDPKVAVATLVRNGSIKAGEYIKEGDVDLSQSGDGVVYIKNHDISAIRDDDGTLFTVVFRVQPEATGSSVIAMSSSGGSAPLLFNIDGSTISPLTCSEGKITVTAAP